MKIPRGPHKKGISPGNRTPGAQRNQASFGAKKRRQMSPMARNFILNYMANGHNATQAALSAGYSPNGADVAGWTLVHITPGVKEEIDRLKTLAIKKSEITATYILQSLKDVADACKVKKQERDAEGRLIERGVVDSAGANRALELLGKNMRLFVDTLDITRRTELADLTDEDLLQVIKASTKNIKK